MATTSTDPTIGMMMAWLHCAAVIVHEFSSFFSTVTGPSFWALFVTASCIYKTSHGDPLPDEKAKKHLCPPPLLKVTFALFVFIVIALVPASGAWYTEGYASVISIVPDNGMMTSMLHWGAVMSHTSSLTFSTVTFPRR